MASTFTKRGFLVGLTNRDFDETMLAPPANRPTSSTFLTFDGAFVVVVVVVIAVVDVVVVGVVCSVVFVVVVIVIGSVAPVVVAIL